MSADSHNACPACYQRNYGTPWNEITQRNHLNHVPGPAEESLREYHELYIDEGDLVFEYRGGECEDCGYEIPPLTLRHPIPEPGK